MNSATKSFVVVGCLVACATGGMIVANSSREHAWVESGRARFGTNDPADDYLYATSGDQPKLSLQQLEVIIRRDPVAKSQRGRMEFGSVRMEEGTALAEVLFVSNDGRVQPFLYKLLPERNSWKIVNVQRMWYVPRSHLLRGVRA